MIKLAHIASATAMACLAAIAVPGAQAATKTIALAAAVQNYCGIGKNVRGAGGSIVSPVDAARPLDTDCPSNKVRRAMRKAAMRVNVQVVFGGVLPLGIAPVPVHVVSIVSTPAIPQFGIAVPTFIAAQRPVVPIVAPGTTCSTPRPIFSNPAMTIRPLVPFGILVPGAIHGGTPQIQLVPR